MSCHDVLPYIFPFYSMSTLPSKSHTDFLQNIVSGRLHVNSFSILQHLNFVLEIFSDLK